MRLHTTRVATARYLYGASGYARDGVAPTGVVTRWKRFLSCLRHIDTFRVWLSDPAESALRRALAHRPSIVTCVSRPYLHRGWSASRKLAVIRDHYRLVASRYAFLGFEPSGSIRLAGLDEVLTPDIDNSSPIGSLVLRLDKPGWFEHEGELTLSLLAGTARLYSLVFTLGLVAGRSVAWIGALQGQGLPEALDVYRRLTHRLHGLRPRDLVVTAFRQLCRSLNVDCILAVSDEMRVSSDPYFAAHAAVSASYDTVWLENGGTPPAVNAAGRNPEAGFFDLSVVPVRRAGVEIPSRKRAQYRRRYVMLDRLATQIDAAIRLEQQGPGVAISDLRCDHANRAQVLV
ncbi:MAG: DUF535 family protein [Chloroflexota bacterium]